MTNEELKDALLDKCPVVCSVYHDGIEFKYHIIKNIVFRIVDGKTKISVNLLSFKKPNWITEVDPNNIRFASSEELYEVIQ